MKTIRVKPNGSGWVVSSSRGILSNHRKKSRAKSAAKRKANSGDRIVIHRSNGTVQKSRQVM
jgi:hypothetical protein